MPRVLIASYPFGHTDPQVREWIQAAGGELVLNPYPRKLKASEVDDLLAGCEAVVASTEPYDALLLDRHPQLRMIARTGVGLDSVDLEACRARGVWVATTPDAPTASVTELTIGLAVTLARQVGLTDRALRAGRWERRTGWLLGERRIGLLGFGRIGQLVATYLQPFGCEVWATDIDPGVAPAAERLGVRLVELDELLGGVDLLSLHVPFTELTGGIVDAAFLGKLREGALLINTARGQLVDEAALLAALESGRLGGAAIDVYQVEPYVGPLASREDVILTAHMGSCSDAGRREMEYGAARAIVAYLEGREPAGRVV